jgi:hypothetical protein
LERPWAVKLETALRRCRRAATAGPLRPYHHCSLALLLITTAFHVEQAVNMATSTRVMWGLGVETIMSPAFLFVWTWSAADC